ncbi:hypothetical protein G3578_09490 [Brevibacillus sp. SYP-B805]|uniref:anti-sigma factor n=1 Tax=Brevibacillus sp. SYP-B805 TaxID=1578199 RepID=UPI0013EC3EE9|nr:anti-sigma factor [Brevibacillus sp. SYP-B805]NGQ95388.1 hypothetical protein [Brevibacillus sp. SYP-B805]
MNCQEFRQDWMHDADNADLTHIETCDDCLNWLEANFTSDEEVMFMKEYPQPSAHLEDRIMHAVYQLAVPSSPATATVMSPSARKRFPRRYQQLGWIGAAAILLAVGAFSLKEMQGGLQESAHHSALQQAAGNAAPASQPQLAMATEPPKQQEAAHVEQEETPVKHGVPVIQEAPVEKKRSAEQPAASGNTVPPADAQPKRASSQPKQQAQDTPSPAAPGTQQPVNEKAITTLPVAGPPADIGKMIASRDTRSAAGNDKQAAGQPAATAAVPAVDAKTMADAAAAKQPGNTVQGIASIGEHPKDTTASQDGGQNKAAVAAEPQITLSTFTDVETAVRASDIPIPSISQPPSGFALSSVSLRYESETSQRVTHVSLMYHRNVDAIKIEVTRSNPGPHNLSVPGTFTDTQVFQIDGEQAIGVTYDPQAVPADHAGAQHAVHFYATKANHSLYVVMTASGISLNDLTELAKQLTWNQP